MEKKDEDDDDIYDDPDSVYGVVGVMKRRNLIRIEKIRIEKIGIRASSRKRESTFWWVYINLI